jgi:hypothetical protein
MEQKLIEALNSIRAKRGMAVHNTDKVQHTDSATRSANPRSQKGRKYSAKQEAKRAAWRQKMGFQTRKERLEGSPEVPQDAITALPAIADEENGSQGIRVHAIDKNTGFTGKSWEMPVATHSPFQPILTPERIQTHAEAVARGYVTQRIWGVYQYRAVAGGNWITCRIDDPKVEAPTIGTPTRQPDIHALYDRPQPQGIDSRCRHAKLGLPPDGSCTGNCSGIFVPNE